MLVQCFQKFSQVSGLSANTEKSSAYFGGVPREIQQQILQANQFGKGDLPFRYLGIPLSTKRLSIIQCKPLIDKMLARIKSWTTRYLSYAGRIQLVKSVLYSIQVYWSQVFVLPKKVVQMIEAICRSFVWTGGSNLSKKALIAWDRLCLPKAAESLNILDIYTWNWAAIGKLLWNICRKKDCLRVKWIHAYYTKAGEVWQTKTTQASRVVQKIIKTKSMFEKIGLHETDVAAMTKYSIKDIYGAYHGEFQKAPWRRMVCNNNGQPKWTFILFLALRRKLQTKERITSWANLEDMDCVLCKQENEDIAHLLFECMYAKQVWSKLLAWQSIKREVWNWKHEERNARIFKDSSRSADQVVKKLIREVHVRARK
uniref:Reverse transcriptase zinc-binding domain-containing protein n=1 Tax=Nicotiana tabacum TaxID=4097 RepID=A0A1S3X9K7_TOBAC